jgi:hypothetical protein
MFRKDIFFKTLTSVLMVLLIGLYLLWNTVPNRLSKTLSRDLQTTVFIGDATFSLNKIGLNKISINSPKNSRLPQAFSCENLSVNTWVTEYLKKDIVIDEITLDQVYLGLEFDSPSSTNGNWTKLMNNLNQSGASNSSKSNKTVLIKKLVITNIQCQVVYANKKDKAINLKPIDRIEFTNISSNQGFPVEQLSSSVLGKMLKEVFIRQNLEDMLKNLIPNQKDLNNLINPFKLF